MFTAGLVAGGVLTATALWLLSGLAQPIPEAVRHAAILLVAALAVLRDAGLVPLPLPQRTWQVPQHVLQRGPLAGALRFGVELGVGFRTYLSATAPYVLAFALLAGGVGAHGAVAAGAGFGLGRGLTALARQQSRNPDAWDHRLRLSSRLLSTGSAVALALGLAVQLVG